LRLVGRAEPRAFDGAESWTRAAGQWDRIREACFGDTFYLWDVLGLIDPTLVVGELGCGTGQLTNTIAAYVQRVIAVDALADVLDAARRRLADAPNVELRQGELESLPVGTGELHAAILSLVLRYSPEPARALDRGGTGAPARRSRADRRHAAARSLEYAAPVRILRDIPLEQSRMLTTE